MSFDLERDLEIVHEPEPSGLLRIHTRGLAEVAGVELELVGIPQSHGDDAIGVLLAVAQALSARGAPPEPEERAAVDMSASSLVVGFVDSEHGEGYLRVVDPFDLDDPESPLAALGTVAIERAISLLEPEEGTEPDPLGAEAILRASIGAFPGDPANRDRSLEGLRFNTENHLAYALLAQLDEDDADGMYQKALERSAAYELSELGSTLDALEGRSPAELEIMARAILSENLARPMLEDLSESTRLFVSPIWEPEAEGTRATRRASVLPKAFERHYYDGEARRFLEARGPELAASLYTSLLRSPAFALTAVRQVRAIYQHDQAPSLPIEIAYEAPMNLLSLLLAEIGRRHRAGLDEASIVASFDTSDELSESIEEKLEALTLEELGLYEAAT
jgi:tetratricopeptide (TPR) repeat protein